MDGDTDLFKWVAMSESFQPPGGCGRPNLPFRVGVANPRRSRHSSFISDNRQRAGPTSERSKLSLSAMTWHSDLVRSIRGQDEESIDRGVGMSVVECDVPSRSALGADLIERADFRDAYRAPLRCPDLGVVEIFFGIFAHRPGWMDLMLIARNKAAALAGLEVPTTSEIMNMEMRDRYSVGEKIGPWPVFFLGPAELVAGRDNKHMDFRVSVMKVDDGTRRSVVVSTLCMIHNKFGQCYLSAVIPFHKFGVRRLMAGAVAAQRL
jgi:hypothetical protein